MHPSELHQDDEPQPQRQPQQCDEPPQSLLSSSSTVGNKAQNQPVCRRLSLDSRMSISKGDVAYGLLITLNPTSNQVELSFTPDAHWQDIHPNCYAPAVLEDMEKLGGGGSGVAVFEGYHPDLGDVVMKHGGDKDLKELFALATIAEELKVRRQHSNCDHCDDAGKHLQEKIPEFRFIYLSPHHLGENRRELWYKLSHLYKYSSRNLLVLPEDTPQEQPQQVNLNKPQPVYRKVKSETDGNTTAITLDPTTMSSNNCRRTSMTSFESMASMTSTTSSTGTGSSTNDLSSLSNNTTTNGTTRRQHKHNKLRHVPSRNGLNMTQSGTVSGHRDIAIYNNAENDANNSCNIELLGDSLTVSVPSSCQGDGWTQHIVIPCDNNSGGYACLQSIVNDLVQLMKEHKWKFTLGQKRIGSDNPKTGNQWLYSGDLHGPLLDNLITQKIQLVRDLATLTTTEENSPQHLRDMQHEVMRFEEEGNITPSDISPLTDSFVGNAIKKNFQDGTGRFPVLGQLGRQFREFTPTYHPELLEKKRELKLLLDGSSHHTGTHLPAYGGEDRVVLTPEEEVPAYHLGCLTRQGALMGDTFENVPLEPTVLGMDRFYWRNLVRAAVQPRQQKLMGRTSPMALTRIWTCGLTDAGVHNLFLTEDSFWLFDLGQPQLYSAPGFLTKFLFSFFHTLGMEETSDGTSWVRRFEHNPETNKLRLTRDTKTLLHEAYGAFETTLDRLINELFDGDDSLRWLLIQYMTLQLLSDASFCLQRWTTKGGGRTRDANHQTDIEKWLWRALWDMYIAFDLNTSETWTRLYVEHPSHRESVFLDDMRDLIQDEGYMAALASIDEKECKQEEQIAV
ncbi:expressed unknown protein [Seminavis robusta]|uniref:Uncharacterized protein n=1 Tax=Seminavis robusta TaxID=568900 RepID=A0A9N8E2S4_9STRA|nr:expressed unknown protein [Seminavis robusta]|eukprot:Sro559_g166390.1 n/a (846) ;mRNA; f:11115-13737